MRQSKTWKIQADDPVMMAERAALIQEYVKRFRLDKIVSSAMDNIFSTTTDLVKSVSVQELPQGALPLFGRVKNDRNN